MKKLLTLCTLLACTVFTFGQTNFQELTLDEAYAKAKAENKLVFVDLYTSWCAPCKYMAQNVFPDAELGKFMNEHFVCVKYDTGAHQDGAELVKLFNVQSYPTFLILSTDKKLENQIVGGTKEAKDFLQQIQDAIKSSLATLGERYTKGDRDKAFLSEYLQALLTASMEKEAREVGNALFQVLPDAEKSNREYWYLYENQMLAPICSPYMDFLFANFKQFTESMGEEKVLIRISTAFEIKLRDMIRGKEKMDDLDKAAQQIAPLHFNSRERLGIYVSIGQKLREAWKDPSKIEELLVLCEREFPKIEGEHLVYFYFPVMMYMSNKGTKEQGDRVLKLHQYIYEHTTHNPLKIGLGNMLRYK